MTNTPITSSELGTLWMTYLKIKMMLKMLDYFQLHTYDETGKNILKNYHEAYQGFTAEIEQIFTTEGAAIPVAFGDNDVRRDAPPLFDGMFPVIFLRFMMKLSLGFTALHLGMTHRGDIQDLYKRSLASAQETYAACTSYLLDKGVMPRPPYTSMLKEAEFVEDIKYKKGIKLFGNKRTLNTVEVAHLYQSIEANVFGTQLMTGFAQVAKESEVRNYFIRGKELAKKIVANLSEIMAQSDIHPPSTWIGRATDSTEPPFSDKIMMFCTSLLSSYALGSNALGTSFSLRNDLPVKLLVTLKDSFQYASEGGSIMIKHKWLEEPPNMEDRNQLTNLKQR